MPETLTTFILRRMGELASEEQDFRDGLARVQREQDELRGAASGANIVIPNDIETALDNAASDPYPRQKQKISEKTIKDTVLDILKEMRRSMTALEMLPVLNDRLNADYPRSSLSPQLSRLKADGLIDLDGRNWSLAKPQTNEAAGSPHKDAPTASAQERANSDRSAHPAEGREAVPGGGT